MPSWSSWRPETLTEIVEVAARARARRPSARTPRASTQRPTSTIWPLGFEHRDELVGLDHAQGRVVPAHAAPRRRRRSGRRGCRSAGTRGGTGRPRAPSAGRTRARSGAGSWSPSRGGTSRSGSCRRPWPGTAPRRRRAAGRRRPSRSPTAMPMLVVTIIGVGRAVEVERLAHHVEQPLGDELGGDADGAAVDEDDELVATHPPDGVDVAQRRVRRVGDRLQQLVAGVVAERVVDVLEARRGRRTAPRRSCRCGDRGPAAARCGP